MGKPFDFAFVGAGIVGTASAMKMVRAYPGLRVAVIEKEDGPGRHQTGHNSGVIHSGLYYRPGSLKARNCADGREAMVRLCLEHGIPHEQCGKIVVATNDEEIGPLDELERRGRANGLNGLRRLRAEELADYEPSVRGVAGLFVPDTGIVDYGRVVEILARQILERDGRIELNARAVAARRSGGELIVESTGGAFRCRALVNCAGLQSDRIARMCGVDPGLRIVPFRGEYYELAPERRGLVRNLIYPVPDPRFPFLGVHFTRMIGGGVEAGPNAVLAFRREGYHRFSVSLRDSLETLCYPGFWRMAARHWRMGAAEFHRSFSKGAFVRALQRLIPDLTASDVRRAGAGVRAQALEPDGRLSDDFRIVEAERMIHVLNAPSPAATASLAIGRTLADRAIARFDLPER